MHSCTGSSAEWLDETVLDELGPPSTGLISKDKSGERVESEENRGFEEESDCGHVLTSHSFSLGIEEGRLGFRPSSERSGSDCGPFFFFRPPNTPLKKGAASQRIGAT